MKQVTALKLTCVGAFVATLGVGCASSGYARYDADQTDADQGVGVSASADVGTDSSASVSTDANMRTDKDLAMDMDTGSGPLNVPDTEGEERITVSALSFTPETRATWVNRFPFYDKNWSLRTVDVYTFAVPDDVDVDLDENDAPEFRADLPEGSVFVEAAGGAGEVNTGRIIQHSPNPVR
jgi:hypothetical protein